MASIFSYDPDPPRVASPWIYETDINTVNGEDLWKVSNGGSNHSKGSPSLSQAAQSKSRVTHLHAEPQEGPIEYKLHLLLRPRRKFTSISTGSRISGSRHPKLRTDEHNQSAPESTAESGSPSDALTVPAASTQQTRQHRLEQLTTQLLWRLQQSSPHHSSSATNVILPSLPDALPELAAPQTPAKLLHGLEESRGALYEIGVSDDGTLVGLAEDEMKESLTNLRAMAACLGCTVEILREEIVGDCEWLEDAVLQANKSKVVQFGKLLVVEALVKPSLPFNSPTLPPTTALSCDTIASENETSYASQSPTTEQLRITLTGPTMCGKSSLLGTLTTSTLDNGRGKSRISMLKHRHEISSGVTSSVTQELLGYRDKNDETLEVVNYATENIASWIDIHIAARNNRLVFISDSAGHPRYRRTTVRGLIGWSPHWTLLCVPADGNETTVSKAGSTLRAQKNLSASISDMDLSGAQLDLCLKLRTPLVVVITKLDLASKAGLKASLTKVLDAIKAAGRRPAILANVPGDVSELDLQAIGSSVIDRAYNMALPLLNDAIDSVPIVLTSAVQGTGISDLHALLHELPMPAFPEDHLDNFGTLFHIEDVYSKVAEMEGLIVSGRLRIGHISVGDTGVVGPFSVHDWEDSEDSDGRPALKRPSHLPTSRSFPGALRTANIASPQLRLPNQEWRRYKVKSIRNLRLPVQTLVADQIGTVAIVPDDGRSGSTSAGSFTNIRKGMVLASVQPLATRSFVAEFKREDLESLAVGNHVVVYIASVRAPARVVSARVPDSPVESREESHGESETNGHFDFDDIRTSDAVERDLQYEPVAGTITAPNLLVTFNFDAGREFLLAGDSVLVMPGGGPGLYGGLERGEKGLAGLEGFVGRVVEIHG